MPPLLRTSRAGGPAEGRLNVKTRALLTIASFIAGR